MSGAVERLGQGVGAQFAEKIAGDVAVLNGAALDVVVALVGDAVDDVLAAIGGGTDRDIDLTNLIVNVIGYRLQTDTDASVATVIDENYESEEDDVLGWFE